VTLIVPKKDQVVAVEKFRDVDGCLVGDEMGVGKTVTAVARDLQLRKDHPTLAKAPTLIICEKIGLDVWLYHLRAMGVLEGEILVIDPKNREPFVRAVSNVRDDLFEGRSAYPRNGDARTDYTYYIMHYDAIRLIAETLLEEPHPIRWFHVIADEVHYIKSPKTQRTKLFKKIKCHYKTGLTGTPADDKPMDFWSPLNWINPKKYRSYWRFYDDYMEFEEKIRHQRILVGGRWQLRKTGYREVIGVRNIEKLHADIEPIYIRRRLLDVEPDMPELIPVRPITMVDLTSTQRRVYDQMAKKSIARIQDMWDDDFVIVGDIPPVVSLRLRQMALATVRADLGEDVLGEDEPRFILSAPSPKLDALMEIISWHEELPFVVFTWFRGMADLIEAECRKQGISVGKIHGGVTSNRTDIVARFQEGKDRVFVGTIAAAGKTITLTRAHHVIFTDRSPNPNRNQQAEARLWRRTQKNTVRVYDIQARNTVDQINWEKIQTKAQLIHAIQNPGVYA
jgi:SNF2 family DNA or RNA helicase